MPETERETEREGEGEGPLSNSQSEPKPEPQHLADLWNRVAHANLPRVKELSGTRLVHVKKRLIDNPDKTFWIELLNKVNRSKFLTGENGRGWRADFDWVMNPSNLLKIKEGTYDNR